MFRVGFEGREGGINELHSLMTFRLWDDRSRERQATTRTHKRFDLCGFILRHQNDPTCFSTIMNRRRLRLLNNNNNNNNNDNLFFIQRQWKNNKNTLKKNAFWIKAHSILLILFWMKTRKRSSCKIMRYFLGIRLK